MAEILIAKKTGNRQKSHSLKIDMTPMVDLGFSADHFFCFTTSMSEAKGLKLFMPADGKAQNLAESEAITVLLGKNNQIYFYEGKWDEALAQNNIIKTNYDVQNGLGKLLRRDQKIFKENTSMLLIKPSPDTTYNNIINVLDEVAINGLTKYAIVEMTGAEKEYSEKH
jgi:biopolymer transport protein ExbD